MSPQAMEKKNFRYPRTTLVLQVTCTRSDEADKDEMKEIMDEIRGFWGSYCKITLDKPYKLDTVLLRWIRIQRLNPILHKPLPRGLIHIQDGKVWIEVFQFNQQKFSILGAAGIDTLDAAADVVPTDKLSSKCNVLLKIVPAFGPIVKVCQV